MVLRLEQLQAFKEAASQNSFRHAAETLFVTPQYVSKLIRQLEAELGVILFQRVKHGVTLTAEGERAYKLALSICNDVDTLSKIFQPYPTEAIETFHLSVLCSADFSAFVMELNQRIPSFNNKSSIAVTIKESCDIMLRLQQEKHDLIFTSISEENGIKLEKPDIYTYCPLFQDELGIFADEFSPFYKKKSISVKDIHKAQICCFSSNADCIPFYIQLINQHNSFPQIIFSSSSHQYCTMYGRKNGLMLLGTKLLTNYAFQQRNEPFRYIPFYETITLEHGVLIRKEIEQEPIIQKIIKNTSTIIT